MTTHCMPTKLAIAGDWHGDAEWARRAIEYAKDNGADAMIQVGDFGFWVRANEKGSPSWEYLQRVSAAVKRADIWFGWLPGNHEWWAGLPDLGRGKKPSLINGNLVFLPIGYRWQWWDRNFMAVGGAFSVDSFMRTEGKDYWIEECLTREDVNWACRQPHGMDVILAHDCPTGINIPGIGPDSKPRGGADIWPPIMLSQAADHRSKMKGIWDTHHPQRWYHGHYHVPHETWYGRTRFSGLHRDGTTMQENVIFLNPGDLGA